MITSKIFLKRSIAFAMVVLVVLSTFTIFAAAEKVVPDGINASDVCDDLEVMGYDLSDYPRDESASFVAVIDFTEYGYHYSGNQSLYGLYIYVYNPSGKKLSTTGNAVELSFNHKDTGETGYVKYNLRVIDVSDDTGNGNVFYKFLVANSSAIGANIGKYRTYKLSSIELQYEEKGVPKPKSFKVAGSYAFTGYQDNFRPAGSDLKLHCNYSTIEVIDVELHGASWYTDTSDLGENYRYEVSSVYFNIPNYYINKYGDLEDETSGLYSVQGQYYKGVTNGIVVDWDAYEDFKVYADVQIAADENYSNTTIGSGFGFHSALGFGDSLLYDWINYPLSFNMFTGYRQTINLNYYSSDCVIEKIKNVFKTNGYDDGVLLSQADVSAQYIDGGRAHYKKAYLLPVMGDLNFGVTGKTVDYKISVDDSSLNSALHSFASSVGYSQSDGSVKRWLKDFFYGDLLSDSEGYKDILPIIEIDQTVFNDSQHISKMESISKELFLTVDDANLLKQFTLDRASENHIYLMRFDVNPYYSRKIILTDDVVAGPKSSTDYDHSGFYFEKVVYHDFDILSFTFKDSGGLYKTVPVNCDPIDIFGSVVTPPDPGDIVDRAEELLGNITSAIVSGGKWGNFSEFEASLFAGLRAFFIAVLFLVICFTSYILFICGKRIFPKAYKFFKPRFKKLYTLFKKRIQALLKYFESLKRKRNKKKTTKTNDKKSNNNDIGGKNV